MVKSSILGRLRRELTRIESCTKVLRPRALDTTALNACADRRRKNKRLLRSACHSSRGVKGTLRRAP